jgi:hypothetical protein
MEAAQEDVTAVKNLLASKERAGALVEVQSLKRAIAQMFDSMSDPYSPSPVHKPGIADELEAQSRYGGRGLRQERQVASNQHIATEVLPSWCEGWCRWWTKWRDGHS